MKIKLVSLTLLAFLFFCPSNSNAQDNHSLRHGFRIGPALSGYQHNYFGLSYDRVHMKQGVPTRTVSHGLGASLMFLDIVMARQNQYLDYYPGMYYSFEQINHKPLKDHNQSYKGMGFRLTSSLRAKDAGFSETANMGSGNPDSYDYYYYLYKGKERFFSFEWYHRKGIRLYLDKDMHHYIDLSRNIGVRLGGVTLRADERSLRKTGGYVVEQEESSAGFTFFATPLVINFSVAYGFN